ncbi:MAG TPA: hypothetical protein VID48_01285 [Solirubrobacteraceae bacterium]|jgi:hypothetical protein
MQIAQNTEIHNGSLPVLSRPDVSAPPARRRRSTAASKQILGARDPEVLRWLVQQYGGRLDHIAALLGSSYQQARRVAGRLHAHKLVRYEQIVVGEPTWVIPTAAGLRFVAANFRLWTPRLALLGHYVATNDVRIHLQRGATDAVWTSERELFQELGIRGHLPDGLLTINGKRIAIEVELTLKTPARLRRNIELLMRGFDGAVYYAAPAPHKRLTEIVDSGRYPNLRVRELPSTNGVQR